MSIVYAVCRVLYDWATVIGRVGLRLCGGLGLWLWGMTKEQRKRGVSTNTPRV